MERHAAVAKPVPEDGDRVADALLDVDVGLAVGLIHVGVRLHGGHQGRDATRRGGQLRRDATQCGVPRDPTGQVAA